MMGLTPDDVRRLTPVIGPSIVDANSPSGAFTRPVPYPQISVSALPEGPGGTVRNLNGLESFMAFNPLGQTLGGATDRVGALASRVWNVASHALDTAAAIGTHYADAYGVGGLGDTVLGDVGSAPTGGQVLAAGAGRCAVPAGSGGRSVPHRWCGGAVRRRLRAIAGGRIG